MKQLIDRIAAQLEKLKRQYPEAAAAYEIDLSLNEGADEADFAELEKRKPIPYTVFLRGTHRIWKTGNMC